MKHISSNEKIYEALQKQGFGISSEGGFNPEDGYYTRGRRDKMIVIFLHKETCEATMAWGEAVDVDTINELKMLLLRLVVQEWQTYGEVPEWHKSEDRNRVVLDFKNADDISAKRSVELWVPTVPLEEREREYQAKYADYAGWKISGYNKYYQYRSTAKNFLRKHATRNDLIYMRAIIDKSLGEL